jgi:threonine dehydratase
MDEARESSYDPTLLTTNVSNRLITLSSIRDAAGAVYQAAIRTPLIRVEAPGCRNRLAVGAVSQARSAAADRLLQDPRRLQRRPSADGGAVERWRVDGQRRNAAQGVAFAARKVGARCSVMVMDTAPDTKIRAIERLGASIVRATYDECWKTVESHGSARMSGHFVHPFDDDRFIAGNATAGLEILEDLPDVDAIVAPLGGGGLLAGLAAAVRELKPETRVYAAEPETAAPLSASLAAGRPVYFDHWQASFVDGAGGKSVLTTMWPLLATLSGSIVVPLDDVARAMKLVAERARVIAEGAAGCAIAAALSGRAGTGKSRRRRLGRQYRSRKVCRAHRRM